MQVRDISVLAAVISIVAMLVIPLPHWLLSFLIIVNITIALLILMTAMNMQEALQFSVFPTLLLLVTLFRLALNVSTTRAILAEGDAG
ncbi:MAG: FHIPEP family type III secretion protein, partial [Psychrobacillus sp.]